MPPAVGPGNGQPAPAPEPLDPMALVRSRRFVVLLVLAAIVGVGVSLAAWGFLELVHQLQVGVFTDLPKDLGYDHGAPVWWSLPFLAASGLLVAFAIVRLPGTGGHIPAEGLGGVGAPEPVQLWGILLAAFGTLGFGVVLGPEAPLIALGGGLGALAIRLAKRDAPPQAATVIAAAGTFAAVSMIFGSPLIAAIILIEASGLGGQQLRLVLLPGLLAAAIGSLVSVGMGSFTGLSTSAYALSALSLPGFARPDVADFGWTIALGIAVAAGAFLVLRFANLLLPVVAPRPFLLLPVSGLVVGGLAIAFSEITGKGTGEVLFSGQSALPGLAAHAGAWSLSALALLILSKGLAWGISMAGFRGGPTFPALFLGAAAGIMASRLPGFELTPGVAVGMSAGVAAVLGLPLSAVVIGVVLTSGSGLGASPLIIVGVVVAYVAKAVLDGLTLPWHRADAEPAPAAGPLPAGSPLPGDDPAARPV